MNAIKRTNGQKFAEMILKRINNQKAYHYQHLLKNISIAH